MSEQVSDEVALIVGGGPGISASCARLFAAEGMRVAVAARNPEKTVLTELSDQSGCTLYRCDASSAEDVQALFNKVSVDLGVPRLVVHNIDGRMAEIFRKSLTEAEPQRGTGSATKLCLQRVSRGAAGCHKHVVVRIRYTR